MKHLFSFHNFKSLLFFAFFVMQCTFSYSQVYAEKTKIDTLPKPQTINKPPRLRIGAQIGYGHRLADITAGTAALEKHEAKLKRNLSYSSDISYYFKNNFGIGIKYNGISARALSTDIPFLLDDGTVWHGLFSENIGIHYIGGFFAARYSVAPENNKHFVFANVGLGYAKFIDNMIMLAYSAKMTGGTAAFFAEIGYDFLITKYFAVGFQLSVTVAHIKVMNFTMGETSQRIELDKTQQENISHLDISLGFKFYK
jgi:hypothetical protein